MSKPAAVAEKLWFMNFMRQYLFLTVLTLLLIYFPSLQDIFHDIYMHIESALMITRILRLPAMFCKTSLMTITSCAYLVSCMLVLLAEQTVLQTIYFFSSECQMFKQFFQENEGQISEWCLQEDNTVNYDVHIKLRPEFSAAWKIISSFHLCCLCCQRELDKFTFSSCQYCRLRNTRVHSFKLCNVKHCLKVIWELGLLLSKGICKDSQSSQSTVATVSIRLNSSKNIISQI